LHINQRLSIKAYNRGGQNCSEYEAHIVKPMLQRAATYKSENKNLFAIYAFVTL